MSLFKSRQWWSTKAPVDEEFDQGNLCVANVDNDPTGQVKIITGSFQGMLRMYLPLKKGPFQTSDLLLEQNLGEPILQIEAGRFINNFKGLALAVLSPLKITVYFVAFVEGTNENGTFYRLEKRYQHKLDHTACNFTFGPFGGVYDRDFLCVQSFDGVLSFFEQDQFAFTRYLNNFLLSGPLCYIPKIDCIVTGNSNNEVECYKYHNLALSGSDRGEKEGSASRKKLLTEWKYNAGEMILSVFVARSSRNLAASQADIVALGEKHLFFLKENGLARMQMKLDYHPSCICSYELNEQQDQFFHNLLVGSYTKMVKIYKETKLVWGSRTEIVPVALRVAKFGDLAGLVVTMDDQGNLQVNYLGTDPSTNVTNIEPENKPVNYEQMDNELRDLTAKIQTISKGIRKEPSDILSMRVTPTSNMERVSNYGKAPLIRAFVEISHSANEPMNNITVSISCCDPIYLQEHSVVIPQLPPHTTCKVPFSFETLIDKIPNSLSCKVVASGSNSKGEPRSCASDLQLPLCLLGEAIIPLEGADYPFKLSLNTDKIWQLSTIFDDMLTLNQEANCGEDRNSFAMKYFGELGEVVIEGSKTNGDYVIKASSMASAWLLFNELMERLIDSNEKILFSFQEELPLKHYFDSIDRHFQCRVDLLRLRKELEKQAEQFRAVQKRLLVRFKDKNAAPLQELDELLRSTHRGLEVVMDSVEETESKLKKLANALSSSTLLLQSLIKLKYKLDEVNYQILQTHLSHVVDDEVPEQGWEESTIASIDYLIRSLAASPQDAALVPLIQTPEDTGKLKKQIALICDKLSKGAALHKSQKKKSSRSKAAVAKE